ncbi:MAG TPA: hypothetical protein PKD01_08890, partial [Mesorhizobium sp.]|nr:hypothetical protein [Mesorhizobium sp.]
QQLFIDAMALPNKVDPFPNLEQAVKLPPKKAPAAEHGEGADAAAPRRRSREERAARRRS